MKYRVAKAKVSALRGQIDAIRAEIREVQGVAEAEAVDDHVFETDRGPVSLSALFGPKNDLIVIHNMGADCAYCTLWADGYNGLYPHIADRAAFVIASPDAPERQEKFARRRGWRFPMVSDVGAAFAARMGYVSPDGRCRPGISVFQRRADGFVRVTDAASCPHDDFCAAWHLFDLLPGGVSAWGPKLRYLEQAV